MIITKDDIITGIAKNAEMALTVTSLKLGMTSVEITMHANLVSRNA